MTQMDLPGVSPAKKEPERDPVDVERELIVNEWLLTRPEARSLTAIQRREVLNISKGLRAKEVAAAEGVSTESVRSRRKNIYRKLDIEDAVGIVQCLLTHALAKLSRG